MARSGAASAVAPAVQDGGAERAGMNVAVVRGVVARAPHERIGADGIVNLSFELRVRRVPDGASELVPVSWPDRTLVAAGLTEGSDVVVIGRVRQRFFRVGGATQSRTEVVAASVLGARQQAAIRRAMAQTAELLTT